MDTLCGSLLAMPTPAKVEAPIVNHAQLPTCRGAIFSIRAIRDIE